MDKIVEIFKDFKARLSNPFFSSFIITWLYVNWQIPYVLLFYKISDLKTIGCNSHAEFISSCTVNYCTPIVMAVLYIFILPITKAGSEVVQTFFYSKAEKWNIRIGEKSSIPIEKYLTYKKKLRESENELQTLVIEESVYINKIEELNRIIQQERTQQTIQQNELNKWANSFSLKILSGIWLLQLFRGNDRIIEIPIELNKHGKINDIDFINSSGINMIIYAFFIPPNQTKATSIVELFFDGTTRMELVEFDLEIKEDQIQKMSAVLKKNIKIILIHK